jgi:deoxyribodipyrimidine photo-lyase
MSYSAPKPAASPVAGATPSRRIEPGSARNDAPIRALRSLPIAQYPEIAPPVVTVQAVYPGASAEVLEQTVAAPLENAINGVQGMIYMESHSTAAGVTQIVTPYVPRGPLYDWLTEATSALAAQGIVLAEWRRDWDSAIWPHATAGFFKLKQQIPRILVQMELA